MSKMSKMKASVFEEAGLNGKYVIYRTVLGDLDYLHERTWDAYVSERDGRMVAMEVSRGHTMVEAINLTKLGNEEG
jgi:hypothetical protein